MPSTATTNVTIGALLDLIGPGAPLPPSDSDSSAFDSLLQSPAPPPAPPPASDPTVTNPKSAPAYRTENSAQRHDPSAPECGACGKHGDAPSDPPQTQHDSAQSSAAKMPETSPNPNSESPKSDAPASDQQAQAAEAVIAESLAGLAAVVPVTTPTATPGAAPDAKESTETEPLDPKAAVAKPVVPGVPAKAQSTPADPATKEVDAKAAPQTASTATKLDSQSAIQTIPATKSNSKSNADAPQEEKISPNTAVKSLDRPADESGDAPADPTQELPAPAHDQRQASSSDNQPAPILDTGSAPPQLVGSGVTPAVSDVPAAVPMAPTPPTVDVSPSATTATETNVVTNPASPQRSRLPAEFLSQTANTQTRRPSVEIDATRLLTRVARAFTAAQERDGEIRLRLSPPELGSLRLDVRVQDGVLVARLQTETDAARTAIVENLPALRDRLSEQGVRIERFDVDLMQRQPGGMPDQPGGRQQDLPPAPISLLAPPRRQSEAPAVTGPTLSAIGSADGLNVVV